MKPLELTELERLLDVHGVDPQHWPSAQRSAALKRIAEDPLAAALWIQAQDLHASLAQLPEPLLPPQLAQAILHNSPAQRGTRGWWRSIAQLWSELGGLRLAGPVLACGLMAGITWPMLETQVAESESPDLVSVAQLGEEQWQINDLETAP